MSHSKGKRMLVVMSILTISGFYGASVAMAQYGTNVDINVPGVSVNATDNSATVKVDGVGTVSNSGVDINTGNATVKTGDSGTRVQVNSGANTIKTSTGQSETSVNVSAPGIIIRTSSGTTLNLETNGKSLSTIVASGVDSGSLQSILSLQGDASLYVKDENDVGAYGKLLIDNASDVKSLDTNNGKVAVGYVQRAKLFGFIPVSMNAQVSVDESGNVSIKLPWYSFLATKDTASLKAVVEQNLAQGKTEGQVTISGEALSPAEQVHIMHMIADTFPGNASVVVDGDNVSVKAGGASVEVKDGNVRVSY